MTETLEEFIERKTLELKGQPMHYKTTERFVRLIHEYMEWRETQRPTITINPEPVDPASFDPGKMFHYDCGEKRPAIRFAPGTTGVPNDDGSMTVVREAIDRVAPDVTKQKEFNHLVRRMMDNADIAGDPASFESVEPSDEQEEMALLTDRQKNEQALVSALGKKHG